ncbi:PREDICTED: uncharacterized protein LOC104771894 [Camelina sativa]|uniref:Uncharacterized protein LOC104771894 n=1 Tax=Camelina sativa TaxID=90675 RepID=A0ABM0Y3B4_CAMSA|nr:PREDICTED: uncharacterized protein LOC104771894 [Camelina sativa]
MDHEETKLFDKKEETKLASGYEDAIQQMQRKEELKGIETRMKEFVGEKTLIDLKLRELIELDKKLETLLQPTENMENICVKDLTEETKDVMILKAFVTYRLGQMETKIYDPQDEFDVIMESIETKEESVKGLKMRMKVFIDEKESEDILLDELYEFNKKLGALLKSKGVENMHLEDMREEVKDTIIMNEIVKKMIAKRDPESSKPTIINNYCI